MTDERLPSTSEGQRPAQRQCGAGSNEADKSGWWSGRTQFRRGKLPALISGEPAESGVKRYALRGSKPERDAGGPTHDRGDAWRRAILAQAAVAGGWRGRKGRLVRSGEGLRITHTDPDAQPNSDQSDQGQFDDASNQHRRASVAGRPILGLRARKARKFRSKLRHL